MLAPEFAYPQSLAVIFGEKAADPEFLGTGLCIHPRWLVTCAHIVVDGPTRSAIDCGPFPTSPRLREGLREGKLWVRFPSIGPEVIELKLDREAPVFHPWRDLVAIPLPPARNLEEMRLTPLARGISPAVFESIKRRRIPLRGLGCCAHDPWLQSTSDIEVAYAPAVSRAVGKWQTWGGHPQGFSGGALALLDPERRRTLAVLGLLERGGSGAASSVAIGSDDILKFLSDEALVPPAEIGRVEQDISVLLAPHYTPESARELDRHARLFGREALSAELEACVARRGERGGLVVVSGPSGQGTTALLAGLIRRRTEARTPVIYHFVDDTSTPEAVHQELLRQLELRVPDLSESVRADLPALRRFEAMLEGAGTVHRQRGEPFVIVLDGRRAAAERPNQELLSLLPRAVPAGVVFALGLRTEPALREWLRTRPEIDRIELSAWKYAPSHDAACREVLRSSAQHLAALKDESYVDGVLERAGGNLTYVWGVVRWLSEHPGSALPLALLRRSPRMVSLR
jgi:hypothetical protein